MPKMIGTNLLTRLVHVATDQHDYVVRDDLQIQTLQQSQHPCAALFNGTVLRHRYGIDENHHDRGWQANHSRRLRKRRDYGQWPQILPDHGVLYEPKFGHRENGCNDGGNDGRNKANERHLP